MKPDLESEFTSVDVEMPAELDAYAVAHGYRSTDAVVSEASRRHR